MSITSFSVVSLIAMVPESECRMPTLIGPVACAAAGWNAALAPPRAAKVTAAAPILPKRRRLSVKSAVAMLFGPPVHCRGEAVAPDHRRYRVQPLCHEIVRPDGRLSADGCGLLRQSIYFCPRI